MADLSTEQIRVIVQTSDGQSHPSAWCNEEDVACLGDFLSRFVTGHDFTVKFERRVKPAAP